MYSMSCRLKRIRLEVMMLPSYSKSHSPSNVRFQSIYVLKILKNIQCSLIIHKIFLLISNISYLLFVLYQVYRRNPLLSSLNYNLRCLKEDKFWRRMVTVVEFSIFHPSLFRSERQTKNDTYLLSMMNIGILLLQSIYNCYCCNTRGDTIIRQNTFL